MAPQFPFHKMGRLGQDSNGPTDKPKYEVQWQAADTGPIIQSASFIIYCGSQGEYASQKYEYSHRTQEREKWSVPRKEDFKDISYL